MRIKKITTNYDETNDSITNIIIIEKTSVLLILLSSEDFRRLHHLSLLLPHTSKTTTKHSFPSSGRLAIILDQGRTTRATLAIFLSTTRERADFFHT